MLWHELSWPKIQKLDKQTPVVIPLGSLEQHGRHLPLLVDTIQVAAVAERVEKAMADRILLLPPIWLGSSDHHLDFPGTVSLEPSLYSRMIQSVARCVLRAGFRRLFFLNGHGGNIVPASQALSELVSQDDVADRSFLTLSSWWQVARDSLTPPRHGLTSPRITHADEYETSMLLFLRPELVEMSQIRESAPVIDNRWTHSELGGKVDVFRRWRHITPSGNMGKPSAATAGKGESMMKAVVEDVTAFLEDFRHWPELPIVGPA